MMKAVITIEDKDGVVKINADFGKDGINEDSSAHYLALCALERITEVTKSECSANEE